MNVRRSTAVLSAAFALLGLTVLPHANACSLAALNATQSKAQLAAFAEFSAGIATSSANAGVNANISTSADSYTGSPRSSVVGMWKFAWTAPDGVSSVDWGFQTWHDDGTEITNSGGRPPDSGNFCMGVWRQTGVRSYSLNHWAIAWGLPPDFDTSTITGLVNIREHVQVTGAIMTGNVSLDLYDLDGTTLLAHLVDGTVTGSRVSPW